MSKCTFWHSVLSDGRRLDDQYIIKVAGLNAPFGARCFLAKSR